MRTYLQNRNGIYYFRCRVPLKYQSSFNGKSEIRQSLLQKSTKNALILSNIFKSLLQELYMLLDHADAYFAQRLVSEFLNNLKNEVEKSYYANKNTIISTFGKVDKYQIKDSLLYYERLHDAHSSDSNIAFEIQELLDEKNIKLSPDSTQYQQIKELFIEGKIELLEYLLSLITPQKQKHLLPTEPRNVPFSSVQLTMQELFDAFMKTKKGEDGDAHMTDRGYREYVDAFNDLTFALGCKDTLISDFNQSHFEEFKGLLSKIPKHRTKQQDTKNKSMKQLLAMNMPEERLFSYETKRKKLTKIIAIFNYAVEHKYLETNYAESFKFQHKRVRKSKNQNARRVSLDNADLQKLFSSPVYTDKADLIKTVEPEKYWIPLIALFTGMRQNEICQLYLDDVRQKEGTWYFNLNDELDKSLKNENAFRNVPIHDKLIELGFLQYYEKAKEKSYSRLWPNLSCDLNAEKYNIRFGKWFMTYFRKHVTADPTKVFHSLRHTAADMLEELTITEHVPHSAIAAILGHEDHTENTTKSIYHSGFKVSLLANVLNKTSYALPDLH